MAELLVYCLASYEQTTIMRKYNKYAQLIEYCYLKTLCFSRKQLAVILLKETMHTFISRDRM